MSTFDKKYEENKAHYNKYIINGFKQVEEDNDNSSISTINFGGDIVWNIIKVGFLISGLLAIMVYCYDGSKYASKYAIGVGIASMVITIIVAEGMRKLHNSRIEKFMLDNNPLIEDYMVSPYELTVNSGVSSYYRIFCNCNAKYKEYLHEVGKSLGRFFTDDFRRDYKTEDLYGTCNFLDIPNIRKVYNLKKRKNRLDYIWKAFLEKINIPKSLDLSQMYTDLYTYFIYDIIETGGKDLTEQQRERIANSILHVLEIENAISINEHRTQIENNDKYKEYMTGCFLGDDEHAGAFMQFLCAFRMDNDLLLHSSIRFLEEFRKFYLELVILLVNVHLYNESITENIEKISKIYYDLAKDIDNKYMDRIKDERYLINVLSPIEFDMDKFLKLIT